MSETGEEQKYVKEAFDTNWVVPLGPNVNGFEDDLKAFVSKNSDGSELSREVVALSAGTAAVHLGLLASGVGPGDEVCVQTTVPISVTAHQSGPSVSTLVLSGRDSTSTSSCRA